MIRDGEPDQAVKLLVSNLKNGLPEIYQQAKALEPLFGRKEKAADRSGYLANVKSLKNFLSDLERNQPDMMMFLAHYDLAERKLKEGEWMTARFNYETASKMNHPFFSLTDEEITDRVQLCDDALQFNQLIDEGNRYYEEKDWKEALQSFKKAGFFHRDEFDFNLQELKAAMNICNKGTHFENNLKEAKDHVEHDRWRQAKQAYHRALVLFEADFTPSREELNTAIQHCHNKEIASSRKGLQFAMNRIAVNIFLLGGILLMLTLLIYRFSFISTSQELPKETIEKKAPEKKDQGPVELSSGIMHILKN